MANRWDRWDAEHDADGKYIPCKAIDDMTLEELRAEMRDARELLKGNEGEQSIFSLTYLIQELIDDRDHYARMD